MSNQQCLRFIIKSLGIEAFNFNRSYLDYFCDYKESNALQRLLDNCNDKDVLDFISKTLVPNPNGRMTSKECLEHPLFDATLSDK